MADKPLVPGTHVRTPGGIGWVNICPARRSPEIGKVFVRLGDDSVRIIDERDCEVVDF